MNFHFYFLSFLLIIYFSGKRIEKRDPFLIASQKKQTGRESIINVNGVKIKVIPHTLPNANTLTNEEKALLGNPKSIHDEQGFYIYRNKRLIIWGTWFRLSRQDELSKLARVMVEIPNSLDDVWGIDIKKSTANIPDIIKKNLYSCIEESVFTSKEVYRYRGRKENNSEKYNYVWDRIKTRDGYEYRINRDLPQIQLLSKNFDKDVLIEFERLLKNIEKSFPTNTVYLDVADGKLKNDSEMSAEEIDELIMAFEDSLNKCQELGLNVIEFYEQIIKTEPYCNNEKLKELMKEKIKKYE